MAILNPIFLQHVINLNTSEPVKLQGILQVHSGYTGTVYEFDAHRESPLQNVSRVFKNFCLFAIVFCCGYCSMSFQSFALHHLVTTTVRNTEKPPLLARCLKHLTQILIFSLGCPYTIPRKHYAQLQEEDRSIIMNRSLGATHCTCRGSKYINTSLLTLWTSNSAILSGGPGVIWQILII